MIPNGYHKKRKKRKERHLPVKVFNDDPDVMVRFLNPSSESESETDVTHFLKKSKHEKSCTKAEKQLTVLLVICILVIVVMSAFLVVQRLEMDNLQDVCTSPACVEISGRMLSQMDLSVDPCADFYEYSCARGLRDPSEIPPDKSKWGQLSKVAKRNKAIIKKLLDDTDGMCRGTNSSAVTKAKMYYDVCMNSTTRENLGTGPLMEEIKKVGSWEITDPKWSEDAWNLESSMAYARSIGLNVFFSMWVGGDDKDSNSQVIVFDQGGTSFSDSSQYNDTVSTKYHTAYVNYFTAIAKLLGADATAASRAGEEVWLLEKALKSIQLTPEERVDVSALYHKMPLSTLKKSMEGWIDVSAFLNEVFGSTIPLAEEIVVYDPNYLANITNVLKSVDKSIWANYVTWHMVSSMIHLMPLPFRLASQEFNHALYGTAGSSPLWEECVDSTNSALGFAVGALFVESLFSEEDKDSVETVLQSIRGSFEEAIPDMEWMDSTTRERALNKARAVVQKIGYPDLVANVTLLDDRYEDLKLDMSNQFHNVLQVRLFATRRNFDERGKPTDREEWGMVPSDVNAYYNPSLNEIVFPAGILQPPLYDTTYPKALVYGGIGMVMGHELLHGFDNTGRMYDKHGNMLDWWSAYSVRAFEERTQCLINEYSSFKVFNESLNGLLTLGENIADNGGVKYSLKAYKNWRSQSGNHDVKLPGLNMTNDQLFFLGFSQVWCSYYTPEYAVESIHSDVHSYAKYRVIGVLQNMPEFSEAFQCSSPSPMSAEDRCSVF